MYHIANDLRAKKSALAICKGLSECLEEKPLSEIKINDIYHKCSVSRSTFYRLFDSLEDVLSFECDSILDDTDSALELMQFKSKNEEVMYCIKRWLKNKTILKTIVDNRMIGVLQDSFLRKSNRFKLLYPIYYENESQFKSFVSTFVSLIYAALNVYFESNSDETIESVVKFVCSNTETIINQWRNAVK